MSRNSKFVIYFCSDSVFAESASADGNPGEEETRASPSAGARNRSSNEALLEDALEEHHFDPPKADSVSIPPDADVSLNFRNFPLTFQNPISRY